MDNLLRIFVPAGWNDVIVRSVKVQLVAFAALVLKEWLETREWDFVTCAVDGAWVAGGVLILNALLLLLAPRGSRA